MRKYKKFFTFSITIIFFITLILSSCRSGAAAAGRLDPPRAVRELRLDDIVRYVETDPAMAIHLLEVYGIIYSSDSPFQDNPEVRNRLDSLRESAAESMKAAQIRAIEEERWIDAASLARSLSRLGIIVDSTGEEPDIFLEYAKIQLSERNYLSAFLAAAQSHNLRPLAFDDALLFLESAAEQRQRRTAAFFLDIIDSIDDNPGISQEIRTYAEGRDTASDMIRGAATVLVDRGIRIDRGMGVPDRVIGSAFFIDSSGLLVTNYHVIASEVDPTFRGNSRLYIRLGDSTSPRIPARVIGYDKAMDLAIIKAEITPEYVYSVIDWVVPEIGEQILAIGSPVGLERTVTQGIVSALGRRFLQIGDVIQIDAAVNAGNSGGPVVDMNGRLIGIVFAGIEQFQGLNFAVPSQRLAAALPEMLAGGKAERPWLGLSLAETLDGAEIIYVAPSTPAAEQQIREGSIIRSINGEIVRAAQGALIPALQDRLFSLMPGELVNLEIIDPDGNIKEHIIRLALRPDIPMLYAARRDTRERLVAPLFGLILSPRAARGIFSPAYQVRRVIRGSIADEANFSENDPLTIRNFRILEDEGIVLLDIDIRQRRMGFMEASMRLPALLDTPDTL